MRPAKYGEYTEEQIIAFRKKLHTWIHYCLVYVEEQPAYLEQYMIKVQRKFQGLNELLEYSPKLVEIMNLLEAARIEFEKNGKKTELYRKLILDAHKVIDYV